MRHESQQGLQEAQRAQLEAESRAEQAQQEAQQVGPAAAATDITSVRCCWPNPMLVPGSSAYPLM